METYTYKCIICRGSGRVRTWILFTKRCPECMGRGVVTVLKTTRDYKEPLRRPPPPRKSKSTVRTLKKDKPVDSTNDIVNAMAMNEIIKSSREADTESFKPGGGSFGGAGASGSWDSTPADTGPSSHEAVSDSSSSFDSGSSSSGGSDGGSSSSGGSQ